MPQKLPSSFTGFTRLLAICLCAGLLNAMPSSSQPEPERITLDPATRHAGYINAIKQAAAEVSAAPIPGSESREAWDRARPKLREQVQSMLGLSPFPKRTPLQAQITGTVQREKYRIEKLVFQSLPGLYVTCNLYLPEGKGRKPVVLYPTGHMPHPSGAKWGYQDRGQWFAEHGFACLVMDTLEFAEVPGIHHGLHDLNMWHWLSLGYTPAGVEVWNAIRALDYLETRPDVDMMRVGITGISGGGAMSWYIPAMDDRISATAPVCGTITYGSQAANWRAFGQCDCIYYPNAARLDFPVVAALIAPRPLLICSGEKDSDFPPDGYHAVYEQARQIYRLYGKEDQIREVDAPVGHTDAPLFLQQARQWMNRWLRNDQTPVPLPEGEAVGRETPEALTCLANLPPDAVNHRIQDQFVPIAHPQLPASVEAWRERRGKLLAELRAQPFGWFPQQPAPFNSRRGRWDGAWAKQYGDYEEWFIESERGAAIRAQVLKARQRGPDTRTLLYVKRPGDTLYFLDLDELLPVMGRMDLVILNPRFTDHPISARELADLEVSSSWSGRTIGSQQVWDILRCLEWMEREAKLPTHNLSLYAKGEMGVLGLYAGLLDERVGQVILSDPPSSHWRGPALLNVLRVTDIPEAAAAFAPRKLTFVKQVPEGLALTRQIYQLVDPAHPIATAPSMPDALGLYQPAPGK